MNSAVMKAQLAVVLLALACAGRAAELRSDLAAGRAYYGDGEFKKAAAHFERAVKSDPDNAASHFWLGKSYGVLGNIGGPALGKHASAKARIHLTKAVGLAPNRQDYRDELFEFLVGSDHSRGALLRAEQVLRTLPESDPDYRSKQSWLLQERSSRSSAQSRVGALILLAPQQLLPW